MASTGENPSAGSDVNPLKSDFELQTLLKKLDKVKKYKTFQRWKAKFLDRLEQFLYEKGIDPAEKACDAFSLLLTKFVKKANGVVTYIEKGDLGDDKKTVKASLALNEMCNSLTQVVEEVASLIPSRKQEEKKKGFSKFHLGAALIRQGFHQYAKMKAIEDILIEIGAKLENVADRQQHELFDSYVLQVQRFCDVMADLHLYEVMLKCIEFAEAPVEEESSDEEDITLEITVDTREGRKTLKLEVDPNEKVLTIKETIADACGILPEKQVLKFRGKELTDNMATLKSVGIENRAKLTVEPFKIPISVKTYDGKTIDIMVDPSIYLSDIKRLVQEESGIPAKKQSLWMNGSELDNDFLKADDCGIDAGSTLYMEPKSIGITAMMPDGSSHLFDVSMSDTPEAIKNMIANETGMPVSTQLLKLNGKELTDGKTLRDLGVRDGSKIDVMVLKIPVVVQTYDGKEFEVQVDPRSYISDIKRQVESETDVPAINQKLFMDDEELSNDTMKAIDCGVKAGSVLYMEPKTMKVNVEMPNGKVLSVEVSPSDTMQAVKDKVADASGMARERQVLKHGGKELSNGTTVKVAGLKDNSTLKVEIFKVPVTVNNHDGNKIQVMVDPTATLKAFKKQLESESGLSPANQKLSMDGDVFLNDDRTLSDYGVKEGSQLDLEPMTITVGVEMPDGKIHSIEISPLDTDELIKRKIEQKTGMATPRQVLKMNGANLPQGKTAKDMGIEDGSKISVAVFKVPVIVRSMDGQKTKVMVDPTIKLSGLKAQLESDFDIPASNQRIFMQGEELKDNSMTAENHGIGSGSELYLEPGVINIDVTAPDGQVHKIGISPSDSKAEIQKAVAVKTGIAPPRQVLRFNGKDLPDGAAARDIGVKEGASFALDLFTIPVSVKSPDGRTHSIRVEPCASVDSLKKILEKDTGIEAKKQCLKNGDDELNEGKRSIDAYGVKAQSLLTLELITDHIIFIDVKCGTLFGMERDTVIAKGALTPHQNNKLDFTEAAKDSASRDKLVSVMLKSPRLGFATQVVVEKGAIDDYQMAEAEKVKNMWGVNLKKREKNKQGEEFIFVDPKTGACGELSRKKYIDMNFVTPVGSGREESIAEAEKDTMTYEKYIAEMRNLFSIKLVQ